MPSYCTEVGYYSANGAEPIKSRQPVTACLALFGTAALCAFLLGGSESSNLWAAPSATSLARPLLTRTVTPTLKAAADSQATISRRGALALTTATLASAGQSANAVQGLTPGRIPGFGPTNEYGYREYTRPAGKSGGHGVGWSEIPSYSFDLPEEFEEVSVSIADLGGTEIDARFTSPVHGDIAIIVAPVMRFKDIGFNARVTLEDIATPEQIVFGFAPEVMGNPIDEEDVLSTVVEERSGGLLYYQYEVKPHTIISATATGNRLFLLVAKASGRQWYSHNDDLRNIASSFNVPKVV